MAALSGHEFLSCMVPQRTVAGIQLAPSQRELRSLRNGNRFAPIGGTHARCGTQRTPQLGPGWTPSRFRVYPHRHATNLVYAGGRNQWSAIDHAGPKRIAQLVAEVRR